MQHENSINSTPPPVFHISRIVQQPRAVLRPVDHQKIAVENGTLRTAAHNIIREMYMVRASTRWINYTRWRQQPRRVGAHGVETPFPGCRLLEWGFSIGRTSA